MADHTSTSPRPSLFARKGEAEPAPAVAYVSLRQMQEKPERREEGPDRRAQWNAQQRDQGPPDSQPPQRRVFSASGSDHDGRRHFTPRSGLAIGQQYVPWKAPEDKAEAPRKPARARSSSPSVSALSALIHRHQDGVAKPASAAPEPAPVAATPAQPEARAAQGPTRIDMSYLSAAGAAGGRPAARKPPAAPPVAPTAPQAAKPPAARKQKKKRKQVTVRLELDQYRQIKEVANRAGKSYQSVMAKAVANFLDTID